LPLAGDIWNYPHPLGQGQRPPAPPAQRPAPLPAAESWGAGHGPKGDHCAPPLRPTNVRVVRNARHGGFNLHQRQTKPLTFHRSIGKALKEALAEEHEAGTQTNMQAGLESVSNRPTRVPPGIGALRLHSSIRRSRAGGIVHGVPTSPSPDHFRRKRSGASNKQYARRNRGRADFASPGTL